LPIFFTHAGARLDVEDIPLEVYAAIKDQTGLEWWDVIANPMRHSKAGELLFCAAAKQAGVECPEKVTVRALLAGFTVDESVTNLPEEYTDGIPDPKAEAGQETT
jgi:hypothetical protein